MKTQTILFVIQHGAKIGFINQKGEEVIAPQFTNNQHYHHKTGAVDFSDLVPVKKGSKWGFIDETGAFKIKPKFDLVGYFKGDLAFVGKKYESESSYPEIPDCTYGYINRTGEMVLDFEYIEASNFENGHALVAKPLAGTKKLYLCKRNFSLINEQGEEVESEQYAYLKKFPNTAKDLRFYDDLAIMADPTTLKYGFVNKKGDWAIEPHFETSPHDFTDGMAGFLAKKKWGFINKKGEVVIPPKYDEVNYFNNGICAVMHKDKWGFIDKTGKQLIELKYDEIDISFTEGLCAVKVKNKWGYIDKTGEEVIQPKFNEAHPFKDGRAMVGLKVNVEINKDGEVKTAKRQRIGFIDTKGEWVISPNYQKTGWSNNCYFEHGLARVMIDKKLAYINLKGEEVWRQLE